MLKNKKYLKPLPYHTNRILVPSWVKCIFVVSIFLITCLLCHYRFIWGGYYFAVPGTDSTAQMMQFVPFLENSWAAGQPFWSFSYGLGGDIFSEFSYYYSTSPVFLVQWLLKLITGTIPGSFLAVLQWKVAVSVGKQFAAMLLMYGLLRDEGRQRYSSSIGAVCYGGALWFIKYALAFDFMTDALLWVPLTVWGIRRYQREKKPLLLVIGVALTLLNSFYFAFISAIFYVSYVLIFTESGEGAFQEKLKKYTISVVRMTPWVILGVGISCIGFLPSVHAFLNADRIASPMSTAIMPSVGFLKTLFEQLFGETSLLSIPLIALVALFLSYRKADAICRRKTWLAFTWLLFSCIPLVSSVMNGFSYASDRWYYIVIFAVAYALPDWLETAVEQKKNSGKFLLLVFLLLGLFYGTRKLRGLGGLLPKQILALGFSVAAIIIFALMYAYREKPIFQKFLCWSLVGCIGLSLSIQNIMFHSNGHLMTEQTLPMEIENSQERYAELIPSESEFYRVVDSQIGAYDQENPNQVGGRRNDANKPLNIGYYGASAYNSMLDQSIHQWLKRDYHVYHYYVAPSTYIGFDDRRFLETAWGVKYKLVADGAGISHSEELSDNVGIDLWYDSVTTLEDWIGLSDAEKDALILQSAVVERTENAYPQTQVDQVSHLMEKGLKNAQLSDCSILGNRLTVGEKGTVAFDLTSAARNSYGEILISLSLQRLDQPNWEKPSMQSYVLSVNQKSMVRFTDDYQWSYPLDTFTFRLDGNTQRVEMKLSKGIYNISDFSISYNSYEHLRQWVEQRNRYELEDLRVKGNNIEGTITNETDGILALNVPYSEGWHLTVDGEKAAILPVHRVFTGIELTPGTHKIKLIFFPPFLLPGVIVSCLSVIVLAASLSWKKVK